MNLDDRDFDRLSALRRTFLDAESGGAPPIYWLDERDLELYDATFGRRIAWKWRAVLRELAARGFAFPDGPVFDWGCGTGAAVRELFDGSELGEGAAVRLWDHSRMALDWAAARLAEERADLTIETGPPRPDERPGLLIVSHVWNELDERSEAALLGLVERSTAVIWVEHGGRETSRSLLQVRELLRERFHLVAPCPHQGACGALAPGNETEWCHHFAASSPEAFRSRLWSVVSERVGIDRRSLPYSFLAMVRRDEASAPPAAPTGALTPGRLIGRPHLEKGRAKVHACDRDGVRSLTLMQRVDKRFFRRLRDVTNLPFELAWGVEGERIVALEAGPGPFDREEGDPSEALEE